MGFRAVKGMNDILPDEIGRWQRLERVFRSTVELCGFREVRTPVVEPTELFIRSIGEATDVVEKEMYSFSRHDDALTLRPEGTAGAARAFIEHKIANRAPVTRWYYLGPMFRAEQPQRGRYRQFYQAGCEIYGDRGPLSDAEMIDMLVRFFNQLGIRELEVCVNTLGGGETLDRYRQAIRQYFESKASELSDHARSRLQSNPLRILDSKDPRDIAAGIGAPSILEQLGDDDRAHWEGLLAALDKLGTPYKVEPTLVRGLDYYTRTLFEIRATAGKIGSQNAIAGGGRYDGLVGSLGGSSMPAVGFALGIERVLLAMSEPAEPPRPICFIAPMGAAAGLEGLLLAKRLRERNVEVELDGRGGSMKSMLRRADSIAARACLIIGESELSRRVVQLKDLVGHTQREVAIDEAVEEIAALLAQAPASSAEATSEGTS